MSVLSSLLVTWWCGAPSLPILSSVLTSWIQTHNMMKGITWTSILPLIFFSTKSTPSGECRGQCLSGLSSNCKALIACFLIYGGCEIKTTLTVVVPLFTYPKFHWERLILLKLVFLFRVSTNLENLESLELSGNFKAPGKVWEFSGNCRGNHQKIS